MFTELPLVTVQLPVFNEMHVVKRLLTSVAQLDYPKEKLQEGMNSEMAMMADFDVEDCVPTQSFHKKKLISQSVGCPRARFELCPNSPRMKSVPRGTRDLYYKR